MSENWRCSHGWLRGEQCEVCSTIEKLTAERDELRAKLAELEKQEPVATIHVNHINGDSSAILFNRRTLHHNDLLYAAAGAVPKEQTHDLSKPFMFGDY